MTKLILIISMPLFMLPWQWSPGYPSLDMGSDQHTEIIAKKLTKKK